MRRSFFWAKRVPLDARCAFVPVSIFGRPMVAARRPKAATVRGRKGATMATIDSGTATAAIAFAREHGLAGRLPLCDVAAIVNNPDEDERTAELLALGFRAGFVACQDESLPRRY